MARVTVSQASSVMPTIEGNIKEEVEKINYIVSHFILQGFEYDVAEEKYHFSFDDQDQANFTQELIRASMVASQGDEQLAKYRAQWRGHKLDGSGAVTLQLTMPEFQSLALYGGTWKAKALQYGWIVKNELEACTTLPQLEAVASKYNLNEQYIAVRDSQPYTIDLSIVDKVAGNTGSDSGDTGTGDGSGSTEPDVSEIETPSIQFAQNDVLSEIGTVIPLGLTLTSLTDPTLAKQQYHLHIWSRNCIISGFASFEPYGALKTDDPSFGEGFGVDATAAELQAIAAKIKVAAQDEYGVVMVSIYPVDRGGGSSEQFFIQGSQLRNRLEVLDEIDEFNKRVPPIPEDVLEEMKKQQEEFEKAQAEGNVSTSLPETGDVSTTLPESGDTPTTLPETEDTAPAVPPKKELWQFTFYPDKSNFLKQTIVDFEAHKAEFEALLAESEAATE